ncbi:uncharacterized protein FIBRA_06160 [Fibroporia radiculosa]|uniref:ATP-dependent RNA helicase n=1 Tax=Fibroporia radiculosa TaxID=599839 RepID=J4GAR5_9APHY|nr:uncharacterized protein FIBRA_06160 [Fibroporia radiculosa]CCM04003.1 predicted protein [Fibroporia radiculosa]
MTASLWARALRTSTFALRQASRCEQLAKRPGQVVARRWASAAVSPEVKDIESRVDVDFEKTSKPQAHADQPEFSTLQDVVSPGTLKAITGHPLHLKNMSPVQAAVLPLMSDLTKPYDPKDESNTPRDLLVRAKTGTGKTLAFLVPVIEARLKVLAAHGRQAVKDAGLVNDKHLEIRARRLFAREHVGALIISPTRELATQIANEALRLSHHHDDMEVRLLVGGNSKGKQLRDWMRGRRDIVVGTPGRLRDLLENEPDVKKGMENTHILVLDEADTLLDMGFRDDIDAILEHLPSGPKRQTFLLSATVSTNIRQVARAALDKKHLFIDCVTDDAPPTHAHVPQYHTVLPSAGMQLPHLLGLLAHDQLLNPGKSKAIVFLPTTKMTQLFATLVRQLARTCLPAGKATEVYEMHSLLSQPRRDLTSNRFRASTSPSILVTSDVSARGVDYPGVTRIVQIGIPSGPDQYVHRVGRTGRGRDLSGRADLVLLPWEVGFVTWQLTDIPLKPMTTNELKNQVSDLAQKYDEDPSSLSKGKSSSAKYAVPYSPVFDRIPDSVSELLPKLDEGAIQDTMISLLGYYMGRSGDMRIQRSVILQGMKDWSVEALGLPTPPSISPSLLQKLGVNDGRTKHSGGYRRKSELDEPHWMGRGNSKTKSFNRPNFRATERDREDGATRRRQSYFGQESERPEREGRSFRDRPRGNNHRGFGIAE